MTRELRAVTRPWAAILVTLAAWGWVLTGGWAFAQKGKPVTMAEIEKAWKEREARVKSLKIKWKEKLYHARGLHSELLSLTRRAAYSNPKGEVIPPRDTEMEMVSRLAVDGERVRYHTAYPFWVSEKGGYEMVPRDMVHDGEQERTLSRNSSSAAPTGHITKLWGVLEPKGVHQWAIWTTIRGCTIPWSSAHLKRSVLTSRKLRLDGAWCVEVEERVPRADLVYRLWLDPEKDYVVARMSTVTDGKVTEQIDVRYTPDAAAGWMPTSWVTVADNFQGRALETTRATVLECVVNPKVRDEEFHLPFPPGTNVIDELAGRRYTTPGKPDSQGPPTLLKENDAENPSVPLAPAEAPTQGWLSVGGVVALLGCLAASFVFYKLAQAGRGAGKKAP